MSAKSTAFGSSDGPAQRTTIWPTEQCSVIAAFGATLYSADQRTHTAAVWSADQSAIGSAEWRAILPAEYSADTATYSPTNR